MVHRPSSTALEGGVETPTDIRQEDGRIHAAAPVGMVRELPVQGRKKESSLQQLLKEKMSLPLVPR